MPQNAALSFNFKILNAHYPYKFPLPIQLNKTHRLLLIIISIIFYQQKIKASRHKMKLKVNRMKCHNGDKLQLKKSS